MKVEWISKKLKEVVYVTYVDPLSDKKIIKRASFEDSEMNITIYKTKISYLKKINKNINKKKKAYKITFIQILYSIRIFFQKEKTRHCPNL